MYKLILATLCTLLFIQLFSVAPVSADCCAGIEVLGSCDGTLGKDDFWKEWECQSGVSYDDSNAACSVCIAHFTGSAIGVFVGVPIAIVVLIIICCVAICCRRRHHHHHTTVVANTAPYQTLPTHDFGHHHHHHSSHHGGHH
ncbi:hypothetical protein DFA_09987 [Cavenderia fasciculata]|uniref:Transmembrane protein n=1 Tax=Cavenderia fasciculata TaxID=261658 RepID=F4Q8Z2_CACFS|nr:uncharacterized protein DFA_09987 [Cavenderia fasciculata]EGG15161.1 hypothetical protein DFA_09987 [Cavenderia fasciculata]|eukprot:XP_004351881.1 hypothetical protein DFA_09987 [Cavenderia fasciculata]